VLGKRNSLQMRTNQVDHEVEQPTQTENVPRTALQYVNLELDQY
jgi:hypothetical protein